MKKFIVLFLVFLMLLATSCSASTEQYDIVATTLPVYDFTTRICNGTNLRIGQLITEEVSCLHDYTLQVAQMRMIESADILVISGAGTEAFLEDAIVSADCIVDASVDVHIHSSENAHGEHEHEHDHTHDHDPHIWLSPENAKIMATNICSALVSQYPKYHDIFQANLSDLLIQLDLLQTYGNNNLAELATRNLITFHDGFAYFAESFDLTILDAVEEESGSEASAKEIIHLVELVRSYDLPAVFTETNGSHACANIISAETDTKIFTLNMAMTGNSYFDAMYHNIDTIKEALG